EVHHASCQIVHRASDFDVPLLFQFLQNRTAPANVADTKRHICSCNSIHITGVLAGFFPVELGRWDGRFDSRQQSCEIANDDIVDCSLYCPAGGMSKDQYHLSPRHRTGELHAAQHVVVDDIASYTPDERVANADIEYDFGWYSGIKTAEYDGCWVLAARAGSLFGQIISSCHLPSTESLIPLLQLVDDLCWGHAVALFLCQRLAQARHKLH